MTTNKKNISVFVTEFTLSKKDDKCHTGKREEKNLNSFSEQFLSFITSNQIISEQSVQIHVIHDVRYILYMVLHNLET